MPIVKTNETLIFTINKQLVILNIEQIDSPHYMLKSDEVRNLSSHPVKTFYLSYHNQKKKQYFLGEDNKLYALNQSNSSSVLSWFYSPALKSELPEEVTDMKISSLQHEVCLSRKGEAYGRGFNGFNQLGNTVLSDRATFTKLNLSPDLNERIAQIACGDNHTLLLSVTGELYSCGNNNEGQLGSNNTESSSSYKVVLPCQSAIKKIGAHGHLSMFLTENGEIYGCGQFYNGFSEPTFIKFTKVDFEKNVPIVDFILESGKIISLDATGNVYAMGRLNAQPQQIATNIIQISSGFLFLNKDFQVESPYCDMKHHKILIEDVLNKQFIESKTKEVKRMPSFHDVRFAFASESNQQSAEKQELQKQVFDAQEDSRASCLIM
ncbi:MAG: hypothetical protein P4L79_06990 [Legionella sp.]|uniref:hypothetical protein n=1 Tax=Legionella sp. TaxID=459 RepID=UPI0028506B85|nr:hypothetical protein [Legionella sp.]